MSENTHSLKVVFMGTPEFAVASLDAILKAGYEVKAVVTVPDKPAGRGRQPMESAVKQFAVSKGLPLLQPEKLRDENFLKELKDLSADLFVVVAFRMLPEVVWSMPPKGSINLHGSLLPQYRGAAPIHRAVMNGETKTGVSTFFLQHEIDTGKIILQREMPVGPDESTGEVHDRMMVLGAQTLVETLDLIEKGDVSCIDQQSLLTSEIHHAPKIFKEDCLISWEMPAIQIHHFIRGLSPYPCAFTMLGGRTLKIFRGQVSEKDSGNPGTIRTDGKTFLRIGCETGSYEIHELQLEGKKRLQIQEFLRGFSQFPARVD
jgi:methionyl-tRNA formyltransferase